MNERYIEATAQMNQNPPTTENHDSLATVLQHTGKEFRVGNGLVGAVETSVTFRTKDIADYPVYGRLGNTANHHELEAVLAALHKTERALVFGSGMAAFTAATLALLRPGDHVLIQENCYGGTHQLFSLLLRDLGVEVEFCPTSTWEQRRRKSTKLAVFESISNPFCQPADVRSLAQWAKKNQIISVCDNTFASPYNMKPCMFGIDLTLESATKYLNGHSDVTAGLLVGSTANVEPVAKYAKFIGGFLPASQCAQLLRGLKTFQVRMERHNINGRAFAQGISNSGFADAIYYGPRPEWQVADRDRIDEQFASRYGGMCTIRFQKNIDIKKLLTSLRLITDVPSLGGTESTVTTPRYTTNRWQTDAERAALGIDEQVLRFSIGLEDVNDLIEDVKQAARLAQR